MKIIGIVAEYNPFHTGHAWQIDEVRRLAGEKHTVISTNLSMEEVARRYTPQIASRLAGEYHMLHFYGDDIRLLKKQKL